VSQLSNHFTLTEAMKSGTALRLGIDNTPGTLIIPALIHTAETILEPVRDRYGMPYSPSSWFRCLKLEKVLCEKTIKRLLKSGSIATPEEYLNKKQHPKGEAVDFEVPRTANIDLARWILDNLEFDQLILEFYDPVQPAGGWVHVSTKLNGNRNDVKTYWDKDRRFTKGLPN